MTVGLGTMNNRINYIGHRQSWGETIPFGLSSFDQRFHLYVIGKTGSKNTSSLRNLIIQHIAAGQGTRGQPSDEPFYY